MAVSDSRKAQDYNEVFALALNRVYNGRMKAIYFEQTGDAGKVLVYGERETPRPGSGEVAVRLHASAVNPSDVKKRAGAQDPGFEHGYVIPHSDGAGIIEAVGDGVPTQRIGERVWVYQAQFQRHLGTAAELICVPDERAAGLPANASFEIGACIGIPVMTAHRCVHLAGGVRGQTVLVTGVSGRVGYYAAQWAKLAGARVVGTAGSKSRCQAGAETGANLVLNYHDGNLVEAVMDFTGGAGVDRIIDVEMGVNINDSAAMLKVGGIIASYSSSKASEPVIPFYPLMFKNISLHLVLVYNMPEAAKQQAVRDIQDALENGQLKHRIAQTFELADTAAAHQLIESGSADGCVVVRIQE